MEEVLTKRILVVDDDVDLVGLVRRCLNQLDGFEVYTASDGIQALKIVNEQPIDLIVLDILIPGLDGISVKKELNRDEQLAAIPVIFLTGKDTSEDKIEGFLLGADDYITKPFNTTELVARVRSVLSRREYYEKLFMTDPLTGLRNIQTYRREIESFFNVAKRYQRTFSLAVIDIDDFKLINDSLGHQAGNQVIRQVADIMRQFLRKPDIPIRYGGDEFVILFPETTREQAVAAVRRLQKEIEESPIHVEVSGTDVNVSLSAGVETFHPSMKDEAELFELADKKMYEDKLAKRARPKTIFS